METGLEIAVIGMTCRLPGAGNIHEFWNNLKNGIETISFFSERELEETGVFTEVLENPNHVKAGGMLSDIEYFDAAFFGYTPREAEITDPQMRIFHECTWNALEDAGYDPLSYKGLIGLYAGTSPNLGWLSLTLSPGENFDIGHFAASQLIQKDYLCLRVSYKLNLNGPSLFLYTTCSTSLVAIHLGCQALLSGECDIALCGGVTVIHLVKTGYTYKEGMINSPDGHCRAFDAAAKGFVGADGVGIVVLKRLQDAVSAGDHIYAIIKGSAINNDGMHKAGFTSPSVKGQAEVIKMALQVAEVEPESIGYIETHGTGTELGDPVEIEGLKLACNTGKKGFCGIGSVKTNIGHTDCAAGAAGFIKTVLAINHRLIPPSLYFETPNPGIDFIDSPFYVNSALTPWENHGHPLRAGVSSFGQGGTNAHVILEEWTRPQEAESRKQGTGNPGHFIALSARTPTALDIMTKNLARHFRENPDIHLADAAFTLLAGRHAFKYRKMLVCSSLERAVEIFETTNSPGIFSFTLQEENRPVVFLFTGEQGEQGGQARYKNMAEELYRQKPLFRKEMDRCLETLKLQPPPRFIFQYILAKMLMECGIKPYALLGEASGETTAQCLDGELKLEDALKSMAIQSAAGSNSSNPTVLSFSRRLKQLVELKNPVLLYFGSHIEKIEKILADIRDFSGQLVSLIRPPQEEGSDTNFLMTQVGCLWLYGINFDWERFYSDELRNRIPLPVYPFESQHYWINDVSQPPRLTKSKDAKLVKAPGKRRPGLYPRPDLRSKYTLPAGETERKLAEIWQEFFGFEQVGTRDDFFELGGDSLKVINLVAKIQKEMDVLIPIPEFFDRPYISALSEYILDIPQKTVSSIEPAEKREYYPLALTQRRLYILQQTDPENISYNIPDVYRLDVKIDIGKFREIFKKMIRRQESFRTSFGIVNEEPVQRIHQDAELNFDIEYYETAGMEGEVVEEIIKNFIRPFDLTRPPLLRVGIIEIAGERNLLITDMHHLISDGISVILTTRDFLLLYNGEELPALPLQYKDFSLWQEAEKEKGALKKQEEYWLQEFAGDIPELHLPLDYPRPPLQSFEGGLVTFEIDAPQTRDLKVLAESEKTTLFMVLLAVYNVLLARLSRQEQIVIGTGVAGRNHEELQNLVGTFINTLPLKNFPAGGKTFKMFLKEIREKTLSAFANQDYPFDELVDKVVPHRTRNRNPLFDVFLMSLVMDRNTMMETTSSSASAPPPTDPQGLPKYNYTHRVSKFDLGLLYTEIKGRLEMEFEYCTKLFKRETIERFIAFYKDIVSAVTVDKNIKLEEIEISLALTAAKESIVEDQEDFRF
jgi:3-oxoacyl-(acyl-carrier-protein) synthase/acyl carrier protein